MPNKQRFTMVHMRKEDKRWGKKASTEKNGNGKVKGTNLNYLPLRLSLQLSSPTSSTLHLTAGAAWTFVLVFGIWLENLDLDGFFQIFQIQIQIPYNAWILEEFAHSDK